MVGRNEASSERSNIVPIASIFTPELREMLQTNDGDGLRAFCEAMHPASTADFLEELSVDDTWSVLAHTDASRAASILQYMPASRQHAMIAGGGQERLARIVESMAADDRVDLLRSLDTELRDELLPMVAHAEREDIRRLLQFSENSVGSVMTTDYATLTEDLLVGEALSRLRLQAPNRETIYYVYVLGGDRTLVGVVTLRQLILARPTARLGEIMEREVVTASILDDKERAARQLARFDFIAMPVVDADKHLVGIITHDDVIDVVVEAATEDVHRLGGVGPMPENYLEAPFVTVWRKRVVWLAVLFVAELLTFTVMTYFEHALASVVVLSMFIPLLLSTGGNSGSQAATLTTRALALGQVQARDWWNVLRHELLMGLALGLTLGTAAFFRGAATADDTRSSRTMRRESFEIQVPRGNTVASLPGGELQFPAGSLEVSRSTITRSLRVRPPADVTPEIDDLGSNRVYRLPANCEVRAEAVNRWLLACVVSQSVSLMCLWGTLIGAILPLGFKRLGVDPGIASSPFVATFVDVTGILVYFSIARVYLL